jgi:hypothetical protein
MQTILLVELKDKKEAIFSYKNDGLIEVLK